MKSKISLTAILFSLLLSSLAFAKDIRMTYEFGSVKVGTSKSLQWGLRAKDQDLHFREISMTGQGYLHTTTCPEVISAGERCVVEVRFSPLQKGVHQGTLLVDLYGERFFIEIAGEGI